jgi:hypothetical protein
LTQLNRLSSAFIKNTPRGKHADGQGLWLVKRADGGSQWVLRISLAGKRRMSNCLQAAGWERAGKYSSGSKRNQVRFVRPIIASKP